MRTGPSSAMHNMHNMRMHSSSTDDRQSRRRSRRRQTETVGNGRVTEASVRAEVHGHTGVLRRRSNRHTGQRSRSNRHTGQRSPARMVSGAGSHGDEEDDDDHAYDHDDRDRDLATCTAGSGRGSRSARRSVRRSTRRSDRLRGARATTPTPSRFAEDDDQDSCGSMRSSTDDHDSRYASDGSDESGPAGTRTRWSAHSVSSNPARSPGSASWRSRPRAGASSGAGSTGASRALSGQMDLGKVNLIKELKYVREHCSALERRIERELAEGTRPFIEELTPFSWIYEPHTVTALIVTLGVTGYVAFLLPATQRQLNSSGEDGTSDEARWAQQLKLGILTAAMVFLVYCVVQLRDSILFRPHPAAWRLVHGSCILYLCALVFMLCQSPSNARRVLVWLDSSMVNRTQAHGLEYAEDCRVFTPEHPSSGMANVYETVTDIYVLAHFLGWFGKALVMRSWTMCLILMVLWELIEYSFQHILTNFHECWWDHWVIDMGLCNVGGAALGMAFGQYWSMRVYNWTGTRVTARDKLKRVLEQFSPYSWTTYTWDIFSSMPRFLSVMLLIFVAMVVELNAFFLKHVLWVPPDHMFNSYRLCLWFLLSLPAMREYYQYLTDSRQRRLGVNVWLGIAMACTEMALIVKFEDNLQFASHSWPQPVLLCWGVTIACLVIWAVLKFDLVPCWPSSTAGIGGRIRSFCVNLCFVSAIPPMAILVYTQDVGYGRSIS